MGFNQQRRTGRFFREALIPTSGIPHGASHPAVHVTPNVQIVLLNWNGWADTIECLESVFRLHYPRFSVIVCDNASADESMENIQAWARGSLPATCRNPALAHLVMPPLPKPIPFTMKANGAVAEGRSAEPFVLIPTGGNLGFAGGSNVGMHFALSQPDCDYIWLLNNDTVVHPEALSTMVKTMNANPKLGICGSVLRDYFFPNSVQTLGGRKYDIWSGRTHSVLNTPKEDPDAPASIDYVEGASMLVRRQFLEQVGLMAEDYFIYFEELDWIMRARGRFTAGYAPLSIVYHKLGQGVGSAPDRSSRSPLSDQYATRNRLVFSARYHSLLLPSVLLYVGVAAAHRFLTGHPENAKAILRGALEALRSYRTK